LLNKNVQKQMNWKLTWNPCLREENNMITLAKLRELSKAVYPQSHGDLVHILCAWATVDPQGELSFLLSESGLGADELLSAFKPLLEVPDDEDKELLINCITNVSDGLVTGRHLLIAICGAPEHRITQALIDAGLDIDKLQQFLKTQPRQPAGILARYGIDVEKEANVILQYGRDLTALAKEGDFDDLCDRPLEIDRILDVLLRKRKSNVALTGPAGVGKTALVELLARRLANKEVPIILFGTRLFELSMGKLVAGTRYRGDFEKRMDDVLRALQASQPAILFIDEMHLIWGAGRAEGVITDAANLLKPFLAREENIRVIGATTVEEYHRYIARDTALARRFQEIRLSEPDNELTFEMVSKQAEGIAKHHDIEISESMLRQAIDLTNRYLPNRYQPDKSVDLLDSTAVSVRRSERKEITVADLLNTLSLQTGLPVAVLTGEDRTSLRNLADSLKKRIIGQDHAVERVTATLIQRRQDLGSERRNLGTFLFAGDTGVGKTELARVIADLFFGGLKALLHLDLAEYNQLSTVNKLIGSPPGYEGSEQEGTLIEWLHTYGSGVLLFDEIEKAHPEVQSLLLGLLDNGRITSARGETMDTRQCVVILTTNAINADDINRRTMGFAAKTVKADASELLAEHFPREFLGRLDDIILFNQLGPGEMRSIMKLRLDETLARLRRKNIHLVFDENKLLDHLLAKLKSTRSDARGIVRLLEQQLLQPIAVAMLNYDEENEMHIELDDEFYQNGLVKVMPKTP
jgi:ATP-dependent Clp protease ATP-binding subunit ClpA